MLRDGSNDPPADPPAFIEWDTEPMGMRAHLTAVSAHEAEQMRTWSDAEIRELLQGPLAVDIDKSWEAAFPLVGSIADTGMMLTDDSSPIGSDLGYGPALFVEPEHVKKIANSLREADDSVIEAHWNDLDSPFMVGGLYDDAEGKEYAIGGYQATVQIFLAAAAESLGVLFAIM